MEMKCPESLGVYLPFPEVTFAISMKLPWEIHSRVRQNKGKQVQHYSSISVLLPKEQGTTGFITSEELRMLLIFFSMGKWRTNCSSKGTVSPKVIL